MSEFSSIGLNIVASDPLIKTNRSSLLQTLRQVDGYNHELRLEGGYYSAGINFAANEDTINDWMQSGINRHIDVYNSSLELIWQGFVNQIGINFGENTFSIGPLVDIGNRVAVTYSTIDASIDPPIIGVRETTAYADNSASQAIYGVWEKLRSLNGATSTTAEQIRDMNLNDPNQTFPYVNNQLSTGSGGLSISVKCLGYWHYLRSYYYTNSGAGTVDLDDKIQDVLVASPNAVFSTDYSKITSNTTQVPDSLTQEQYAETVIKNLNSYGDASNNPYSIGFYNDRILRYEVIPTTIEYQKRRGQDITDDLGGIIRPWNIKPAKWMFQPDILIGRHPPITSENLGNDPRAMLIETVKYTTPYTLSLSGTRYGQLDQALARNGLGS